MTRPRYKVFFGLTNEEPYNFFSICLFLCFEDFFQMGCNFSVSVALKTNSYSSCAKKTKKLKKDCVNFIFCSFQVKKVFPLGFYSLLTVAPLLALMNVFWFWKIANGLVKTLNKAKHSQ